MKNLQFLVVLAVFVPLALAGLSGGYGGGGGGASKHHKPAQHVQIKGGIGDGYIYPAKGKHHVKGGSGSGSGHGAQTYKVIIQNGGSQGGHSQPQHAVQPQQHQPTQVKTFKVIQERAPAQAAASHGRSVKTIKLIHVKGGSGNCAGSGQGWQ